MEWSGFFVPCGSGLIGGHIASLPPPWKTCMIGARAIDGYQVCDKSFFIGLE